MSCDQQFRRFNERFEAEGCEAVELLSTHSYFPKSEMNDVEHTVESME